METVENGTEVIVYVSIWDRALEPSEAKKLAALLSALADPTRLHLISLLGTALDGELSPIEMSNATGLAQGTISHHLRILARVGLIGSERRGVRVLRMLRKDMFSVIADLLRPPKRAYRAR